VFVRKEDKSKIVVHMRQLLWFVCLACSLNKGCRRNCLQRLEMTDERTTKVEFKILK